MAPPKKSQSKPAGKQKVSGGSSGGMHKFAGAGPQAPGVSAATQHPGKGGGFAKAGPSGKMTGNMTVQTQKPGVSQQNNSIGRSSYAK
jgi:hypothetical protein